MEKIKIIIADDHAAIRRGYISLLEEDPNFKVIGQAEDGRKLIDLLKIELPDIILLDLKMPVMSGAEALEIIRNRFPEVKIIIISTYFSDSWVTEFFKRGVSAYLAKGNDFEVIPEAIYSVHKDGYYFSKGISIAVVKALKSKADIQAPDNITLSDQESKVVRLICAEKTNKEIADALNITVRTVDFHKKNIYLKTKTKNTAGIVIYAFNKGILILSNNNFGFGKVA